MKCRIPLDLVSCSSSSSKARMKIVDINACLGGDGHGDSAAEARSPPVDSVEVTSNCSVTDVEEQARSIAQLKSNVTQTRLLSASVNNVASPASIVGKVPRMADDEAPSASAMTPANQRTGSSKSGQSGISAGGIIRKQLIYLGSVLKPAAVSSSSSSPTAAKQRVARKSQTTDLISIGHVTKGSSTSANGLSVAAVDQPRHVTSQTKKMSTSAEFEDLPHGRGGVRSSAVDHLRSVLLAVDMHAQ